MASCMSGSGGGGGGKTTVGLGFAPVGSTTPTLVAGSTATLIFIVDNLGGLASSGAITVSFPLTLSGNSSGVAFSARHLADLGGFSLRLLDNGNIKVGIFPYRKKIFVDAGRLHAIFRLRKRSSQL